jgi:hypothetical protein
MAPLYEEVLGKYPNKYFVETGSHMGDAVEVALKCGFKKIITIEIDGDKVKNIKKRFKTQIKSGKVVVLHGDTSKIFSQVIESLDAPATFWLDAHRDDGYIGDEIPPLVHELQSFLDQPIKEHTLLIDDRRIFGKEMTWGQTLTEEKILKLIDNINSDYKILYDSVGDDVIIAKVEN